MTQPYDAVTKYLIDTKLADWLPLAGYPTAMAVEVINADLTTLRAEADRVLLVGGQRPWILHVELQSSRDPILPRRVGMYNVLLEHRHDLPVLSMVVLLRPSADGAELTGVRESAIPGEPPYLRFQYRVVRLWELPVETFLRGGLGIVPLAPLSAVREDDLPVVIHRMQDRIDREAPPQEAAELWTATNILMGLRYPEAVIAQLLRGVRRMKESVTYQAILEEGREKGREEGRLETARELLLRIGRDRFGSPSAEVESALHSIADPARLDRMADRLMRASGWEDLLATP